MRRRELLAGVGSLGVLAGASGIVLGGIPSFRNERSTSTSSDGSEWPVEIETIDARGSEAGTITVPNGDVTVVMFFVTGCGQCQTHMPRFAEARSQLVEAHEDELTFLSVTYQSPDTMPADELRSWWTDHGGNWNVGYDPDSDLAANYRVVGYPVTLVIDGEGEKRWEELGVGYSADIVEAVESVVESRNEGASDSSSETNETAFNSTTETEKPTTTA
ncbi:TlpA disulfide reductase family protein [Natrinema halophilum]|uniref:TlpA family protein disulfide reductase n=1 Tax=Natrinema halophilum TaxID=1699371 RepID=A0A7D5L3L7_9EURY|nr:TlpA disulfide reductase family protein [Natrinema halophilum]QLG50785.1 TlpA family protein disulfide reductase [Natrinema halophilum]